MVFYINIDFFLGGALALASLVNCFARYDGSWKRFFTILMVQLWFAQGVYNYLRGGRVAIAPGGLSKDANPEWRAALAGFALFLYVVVFFLDI
ncbi:hypothetical protein NVV94_03440 [Pseudomonas sp. LS1212]|uniref:hypothetical protein n=1 Tax=Pseudomonas sp. LS1212 TaxID=2972478 RepID=UPI00215C068B|nr:hypothetical protein [Pseudomonas sp. LS1212]UVJ44670.1 hypothetical protein NVV94_03440 [Pseudomonas sp. LS1212]